MWLGRYVVGVGPKKDINLQFVLLMNFCNLFCEELKRNLCINLMQKFTESYFVQY